MNIDLATAIEKWANKQPVWQHRALDRLCKGERIDEGFIRQCLKECIQESRQSQLQRPGTLSFTLYNIVPQSDRFCLKSLNNVKGVNKIKDESELKFHADASLCGLTVIYGPNGSGKTGYSRILKVLAGKSDISSILPNVFSSTFISPSWSVNGADDNGPWKHDFSRSFSDLSKLTSIQVFDESLAKIYRQDERELSFSPPVLQILDDLIALIDEVKSQVWSLIVSHQPALPKPPSQLSTGIPKTAISKLSRFKTENDLREALEFTVSDEQSLKDLELTISSYSSNEFLIGLKQRIDHRSRVIQQWRIVLNRLSSEKHKALIEANESLIKAQKLASASSQLLAKYSYLEGIGSEEWRALWEMARRYSEQVAFPSQEFPVKSSEARCVLCQQELAPDAQLRLVAFEDYIRSSVNQRLRQEQEHVRKLTLEIPTEEQLADLRDRTETILTELNTPIHVDKVLTEIQTIVGAFLKLDDLPQSQSLVLELIRLLEIQISSDHERYQLLTDPSKIKERSEVLNRQIDLQAKKWVFEQSEAVIQEWQRLLKVNDLEKIRQNLTTTEATNEKTRLHQASVTEEIVNSFNSELRRLTARSLRVAVQRTKAQKGKVLHKPSLVGTHHNALPHEVLSEGEQKLLALAAFLADQEISDNKAPFIFDDPVSSLDHVYENAVARRLADLSKHRQVIILTHRLSFVFAIERASVKAGSSVVKSGLSGNNFHSGIQDEFPMDRNPKSVANDIISACKQYKKEEHNWTNEQRRDALLKNFSRMRRAVEQSVEKVLLSGIVKRFDQAVHTDVGLKSLTRIVASDCDLIDRLMTTYSRELHDQPEETDSTPISVEDLESDAQDLVNWIQDFSQRKIPVAL